MGEFPQLLMNAPVLITVQRGKDLRLEVLNLQAREAVGRRDLTGKTLKEAFPELEQWIRKVIRVVRTGQTYVGVDEPVTLDWSGTGRLETRYLTLVCQPLRDAGGKVDGSVLFAIDVTADLLARAMNPHDRAWLDAALDSIATPVMLVEPTTLRVVFANAAARKASHGILESGFQLGSSAMGPKARFAFTDAAGRSIPVDELPAERAARGEIVDGMQFTWNTAFGSVPLVCFAEKVPATRTLPSVVVLSFFDSSDAQRLERELFEAVAARDEFLSLAGHELRTPLTALKLQIQSLMRSHPQMPGIAAVDHATARMHALVEQMLESARLFRHGVHIQPEDLNLCSVVDDVIARYRADAQRAGSALMRVGPGQVGGRWDRMRLERVLGNLVSNAIRFGSGKPIAIECRDLGERASVSVTDSGIGIDPADRERIFERFGRAVSSRNYGGLGLGLWMTREIVTQMGGSIRVEAAPERGATFIVELPKTPPASPPSPPSASHPV